VTPDTTDGRESLSAPAPLRATAIVGVGSIITLALSVIAAKAYALLLGPAGVGLLALMQSLLNLGVMLASIGLSTTVIRAMARALAGDRPLSSTRAVEQASNLLGLLGGTVAAGLLIAMREPIADAILGSPARSRDVVLLSGALLLTVAAAVQVALLSGGHRVRAVATVSVVTGLAATGLGVTIVGIIGEDGIAVAMLVTAGVQLASSWTAGRWRRTRRATTEAGATVRAFKDLLMLGVPVTASHVVGSGAQLVVPIIVLQVLGTADVGHFRAAGVISMGYLTVFLAALAQDYLPRAARARNQVVLGELVERRMRLILGLGIPIILALLASVPWLIDILYTSEFGPAREVLQWQLVGDLARLPAWVLVLVLLARGRGGEYFGAELLGGAVLIGASLGGMLAMGLVGAGVGYAVSQVAYYAGVWMLVRRHVATTPGRLQAVLLGTISAATILLLAPVGTLERSIAFAIAAIVAAALAWPRLYQLHNAGRL